MTRGFSLSLYRATSSGDSPAWLHRPIRHRFSRTAFPPTGEPSAASRKNRPPVAYTGNSSCTTSRHRDARGELPGMGNTCSRQSHSASTASRYPAGTTAFHLRARIALHPAAKRRNQWRRSVFCSSWSFSFCLINRRLLLRLCIVRWSSRPDDTGRPGESGAGTPDRFRICPIAPPGTAVIRGRLT